jgi:hypothetical protein
MISLTPEQEKILKETFPNEPEELKTFLVSELQLERERVIVAFRESASVFFREHDMKPCECLMKYLERTLK